MSLSKQRLQNLTLSTSGLALAPGPNGSWSQIPVSGHQPLDQSGLPTGPQPHHAAADANTMNTMVLQPSLS